jgi:predicted phage baseplate assembly protein
VGMSCRGDDCCGRCAATMPRPAANPPGQASLRVRAGTRDAFLAAMVSRLASSDFPELAGLTTRTPDDPALALLDAWACVCDVLTFYQERIADEGYLGTATERASLVELARLVGYRFRPGLAASAWLAYTLDPDPADPLVTVPAGSRVQSVPDPGGKPQIFETADDLAARSSWAVLTPRLRRPMMLTRSCVTHLPAVHVSGVSTGLAANDRLLFHFSDGRVLRIVESVEADVTAQVTTATLRPPADGGNAGCNDADLDGSAFLRLEALQIKTGTFGAAAPPPPLDEHSPINLEAAANSGDWTLDPGLYNADDSAEGRRRVLPLDADYPRILPGSWIAIDDPGGGTSLRQVESVASPGVARYGISGKVTSLVLDQAWFPDVPSLDDLRGYTIHAQAVPLTPADEPVTAPVTGRVIDLGMAVPAIPAGRWVIVSGLSQQDATPTGEVVQVLASRRVVDPGRPGATAYTALDLATPLRNTYRRATVTVWGNAVRASNGETKDEPAIGSGDAGWANQQFTLRQAPLTYVADADAEGARAALTVRVGGIAWHEVPELTWAAATEHVYEAAIDQDGGATVRFGDGRRGARLPTGTGNISARYQIGLGRAGNVRAGQLNQLQTKPLGISTVVNPLPASGGADPDANNAVRSRAPLPTLAINRLVGLRDYADFTLARAGIGKAAAARIVADRRELVHLTVAGAEDALIEPDSDLLRGLLSACRRFGDPGVTVVAASRARWNLVLEARVLIDADRAPELVGPQATAALTTAFGFDAREIGQSVYLAEIVAALHGVPGVAAADVRRLGATTGSTRADADAVIGVSQRVPARAARIAADGRHVDPADLVVVTPGLDGFVNLDLKVVT